MNPPAAPSTPPRVRKAQAPASYTPKSASAIRNQGKFGLGKTLRAYKRSPFVDNGPACYDELPTASSPECSDFSVFSGRASPAVTPITPMSIPGSSPFLPVSLAIGIGCASRSEKTRLHLLQKPKPLIESLEALRDAPSGDSVGGNDGSRTQKSALKNDPFGGDLEDPSTLSTLKKNPVSSLAALNSNNQITNADLAEMTIFGAQTPRGSSNMHQLKQTPCTPSQTPRIEQTPQFEQFTETNEPVQIVRLEDVEKIPRLEAANPFVDQGPRDYKPRERETIDCSTHIELVNSRTGERKVELLSAAQQKFKPKKLDFTLAVVGSKTQDYKIANKYLGSNIGKNFTMGDTHPKGRPDFDIFKDHS